MPGLVIFQLGDDPEMEIAVTTDDAESQIAGGVGIKRVGRGRGDRLEIQATKRFEQALEQIKPIAHAVVQRVKGISESISEVEVEFLASSLRSSPGSEVLSKLPGGRDLRLRSTGLRLADEYPGQHPGIALCGFIHGGEQP